MTQRGRMGAKAATDGMTGITVVGLAPRLCAGRWIPLFDRAIVASRRWRDGRPVPGALSCRGIAIPDNAGDPSTTAFDVRSTQEAPYGRGRGPRVSAVVCEERHAAFCVKWNDGSFRCDEAWCTVGQSGK